MVKPEHLEMFDALSRNHRLKEWLDMKVAEDTKVLMQSPDIDQLRRAQGRAGAWQTILDLMDTAPSALAKQKK